MGAKAWEIAQLIVKSELGFCKLCLTINTHLINGLSFILPNYEAE